MLAFFLEGGFVMWVILILGLVFLGGAVRFAARPDRAHYGFLTAMGLATLAASVQGVFMDLAQVMWAMTEKFAGHPEATKILYQGVKECTRPATFGGAILVLGCIAVAVGASRLARRG